ncbi:glycosyltransferase [Sphingomonas sp. H39-1-10]|uniref:glycosyltransferase n=1 Tax=Sphingomonas pollutisoli TaxID=3030829 RepID=UPI0023B92089|nr:glycosyltransferase [Sphingomonas pollutisoli]MDF0486567.1 glycosyltransferase [Sphingomonas pollutisoli]
MNRLGGAEENTWASCVHQAQSGHIVHLFCGRSSDVEEYTARGTPVRVHLVEEMVREVSAKSDIAAYRRLSALFEEIQADVVHTHTSKAGIVGRFAASNAKVPAVIHGVHILPFSNVGLAEKVIYLAAEHIAAPLTDHFIHVSHGTRDAYALARLGGNRLHSVVRSGMDIDRYQNAPWPDDWRDLIGVGPDAAKPRTILMMAVLEARKRQAEFITGFAEVTRPGEDIRLLIAGDGPERETLAALVERLDVGDRVKLLGHRSDPERLVALADICALASLREGLPRTIVQSLAGGKPAVVSPLRGIEEIIESGVNGIVVRRTDAQSVAYEAVGLLRDDVRLARMTHAASCAPVEDWKFAAMFAQLDQAYRETLALPRVAERLAARDAARGEQVVYRWA